MTFRSYSRAESQTEGRAAVGAVKDAAAKDRAHADAQTAQPSAARPSGVRTDAGSPEGLLQLQRQFGNRAVRRLLAGRGVQAKLRVEGEGEPAEREADAAAERVLRAAADGAGAATHEAAAAPPAAAAASAPGGFDVDARVEERLARRAGGGSALPDGVREQMEQGFGADFRSVRVHADAEAAALNRALSAQAFTYRADIYFDEGQYDPHGRAGRQLLAHELTHVLQQGAAPAAVRRKGDERAAKTQPPAKTFQPVVLGQLDSGDGQPLEIKRLTADGDGVLALPEAQPPAAAAAPPAPAAPTPAPASAAGGAQAETAPPPLTILKQNKAKEWEPVAFEQLPDGVKSRLVTNHSKIQLKNGYAWILTEFKYADEKQATKRWAQSKSKRSEVASAKQTISSQVAKLPTSLQADAKKYAQLIAVVSSVEGSFGATSGAHGATLAARMKQDTSASLGIFQWAHDRAKAVQRGSSLGDFFYTLKQRADEAAKVKEEARTEEQKLYVAAWKQCTDLGFAFEGNTLTMKSAEPVAPPPPPPAAPPAPQPQATPPAAAGAQPAAPAAAPAKPKTRPVTSDELERQLGGSSGEMGKGALRTYQLIAALDWIKRVEDTVVRPGTFGAGVIGNGYEDWGEGRQAHFKTRAQGTMLEVTLDRPGAHETVKTLMPALKQTATAVMLHVNRPHYVEAALWRALIAHVEAEPAQAAGALLDKLAAAAVAEAEAAYKLKNAKNPFTLPKKLQLYGKDKAKWPPEAQQAYDALAALIWPRAADARDLKPAAGKELKPEELEQKKAALLESLRLEFVAQALGLYPGAGGHGRERRFAEIELESW
ncbi:MAG TPA: DUF4157 domain-containing protein [Pyrinomonadaceae bacterium]|jgi:hypothetical protein